MKNLYDILNIVHLERKFSGKQVPVLFLFQHDEEYTARKAVYQMNKVFGYPAILVSNNGNRLIKHGNVFFDPNRIFSRKGLCQSLAKLNPNFNPQKYHETVDNILNLGKYFINDINDSYRQAYDNNDHIFLINVHNSLSSERFSIDSFTSANSLHGYKTTINDAGSKKDFYYIIDEKIQDELALGMYNIVLQTDKADDDGSLSFAAINQRFFYITIECEIGRFDKQVKMCQNALETINKLYFL